MNRDTIEQIGLRAMNVMSVPNINIFLKITSILRLIDDFSYYRYHLSPYDSKFKVLAELAWNITNFKWVPQPLEPFYNQYINGFTQIFVASDAGNSPATWLSLG